MTRVLIVDDQHLIQEYLKNTVEKIDGCTVAGVIGNASLSMMYCDTDKTDLILMDVCTENSESGLKASAEIKAKYPDIKIIIITSMPEVSFIEKARNAHCDSFWYKDSDSDKLISVIEKTLAGISVYPDASPTMEIGNIQSTEFTKRELEILRELVNGKNQNEIATEFGITRSAVKYHIANMLQKTGYNSYVKLIIDVVEKRLIIPNY